MTGEITIRGNVLAIGGLREKTMAAYSAGVRTIIIPADNLKDLDKIDPVVRENATFIPCRRASEVLSHALCPTKVPAIYENETPCETVAAEVIQKKSGSRTSANAKSR
jgi:ATP-dependent Lon protease